MSTQIGGYIPEFKFRLNKTYIDPYIISSGTTGVNTGQFLDVNRVQISYTNALTGTQYNIQTVPEQYVLIGQNPNIILQSSNTGIGPINVFNNVTFVSTGNFNIIGSYTGSTYNQNERVILPISIVSGGGDTTISTEYRLDNVQPSKHVLIVYNSGSTNSTNLKFYYTGLRPQFSGANILNLACPSTESISYNTFITGIQTPIINFLTGVSGSKPIRYIVMMSDIPTRISDTNLTSVPVQLNMSFSSLSLRNGNSYQGKNNNFSLAEYQGNTALISYINLGSFQDCTGYIDKISKNQTGVYLTGQGNNTGYYFEDYNNIYQTFELYTNLISGRYLRPILNEFPTIKYIHKTTGTSYITTGDNLAGFSTWGANCLRGPSYANDGSIKWGGTDNWYVMTTIESFNGKRDSDQGNFIDWFSGGAFNGLNGTGYNNIPVGAVCHVEEPFINGIANTGFFLLWQRGYPFIECAWQSRNTPYFLAVGDPLIKK